MKKYVCMTFAVFVMVAGASAQTTNPNYEVTFLSEPPFGKAGWDRPRSVAADGNGFIFVLRPSDPPFATFAQTPVVVFNRAGEVVNSWGDGLFPDAHSIDIDHEGFLWITDKDMHMVYKFTREGRQLMALGEKGIAGDNQSTDTFNGPADVVVTPNGDFFVADGHYNSRVVHFSKDGEFIEIIGGTKGSGPGEFDVPHSVALDSQGRLLVADEQPTANNARVQVFDQNGTFIEQWANIGLKLPTGLAVAPDDTVYIGDTSANAIFILALQEIVWVISVHFRVPGACRSGS